MFEVSAFFQKPGAPSARVSCTVREFLSKSIPKEAEVDSRGGGANGPPCVELWYLSSVQQYSVAEERLLAEENMFCHVSHVMSVFLSVCLSVCLSACLSVCLSVCLSREPTGGTTKRYCIDLSSIILSIADALFVLIFSIDTPCTVLRYVNGSCILNVIHPVGFCT